MRGQRSVSERYHQGADPVSTMVKEHSLSTRHRAVGMVSGGMTQAAVAKQLRVSVRSIQIWMARDRKRESLENHTGRGRQTVLTRASKIVLAKVVQKRHQSMRKLATKLTAKGHPVSKTTVHNSLTKCPHLKAFKPRCKPKLIEVQKIKLLAFARERRDWSIQHWRRVLFSDQSSFETFHRPNRQNDRVWARSSS